MEAEKPKQLPYVDRVDVSEVFSDQIRLTHWHGHSVRVEFAVGRPSVTGPNQSEMTIYPVARLVLSPKAAIALHHQLSTVVAALKKQGIVKQLAPSSGTKQ
jgi:hypothetical protein